MNHIKMIITLTSMGDNLMFPVHLFIIWLMFVTVFSPFSKSNSSNVMPKGSCLAALDWLQHSTGTQSESIMNRFVRISMNWNWLHDYVSRQYTVIHAAIV